MTGPTRCICGITDLTENGHESGCPMRKEQTQQLSDADKLANIRFAVSEYADAVQSCPVRQGVSKGLFCSRCGAGSNQICGLSIDAGRTLVKAVELYTSPASDRSMPPAATIDALHALADRMGTSADLPFETVKNQLELQCYKACAQIAADVSKRLRIEATQWAMDNMPGAQKDAAAKGVGADMVRVKIEQTITDLYGMKVSRAKPQSSSERDPDWAFKEMFRATRESR